VRETQFKFKIPPDDWAAGTAQGIAQVADPPVPSDPVLAAKVRIAQTSLIDFTEHTYPTYKTEEFHRHLAQTIQKVVIPRADGTREIRKLMIFAPPQHGKSELVSIRTPPFWMAHNPELPVALISYAAAKAYDNSRRARSVLESETYRDIFPYINGDPNNRRVTDWHILGHKGYALAAGLGGPITGHGFGLGIIDDPFESWADAQSEVMREAAWSWYDGTFRTRMWENSAVIFMMTRWHLDDLAGRLLESEGEVSEGGEWVVLRYPALAEEGDILGRDIGAPLAPKRFSQGFLLDLKEKASTFVWNAEYQQHPIAATGDVFNIARLQIVDALPSEVADVLAPDEPGKPPRIVEVKKGTRYWDLAGTEVKTSKTDPDWTVGTGLTTLDGKTYIWDVERFRASPEGVRATIKLTAETDGRKVRLRIEQEGGQAGKAQVQDYITLMQGWDVDGDLPSGDKRVRAMPLAAQVNAGNVFLLRGAWNKPFMSELAEFDHGRHDDQVDSADGAYNIETGQPKWRSMGFKAITGRR
jgi:predicted phage terminase large subunit-like protein